MFKTYFGDIKNGQLLRLPFLGYHLLLAVIMLAFGIGIAFAIGIGEQLIGGDLDQAQNKLRNLFATPVMIVLPVVAAVALFAGANIVAKRIRNIGLPGWWSLLILFILGMAVSAAVGNNGSSPLQFIVLLALLFIPANTFGNRG